MILATVLRFVGLSWGLRHPTHIDERNTVVNVVEMADKGDLDHRYYNYPGLLYYLLLPFVASMDAPHRAGNDPYLLSRAVVASVGVGNVVLVSVVASRLLGPAGGLAAAFFLAVSPVDIRVSHEVRADILLQTFGLLSLLVFRRLGTSLRGDAWAGVVLGGAFGTKFTGLFLLPFYLVSRWLAPGPRLRGALLAGAVMCGVFAVTTPYALIHASQFGGGPSNLADYYGPALQGARYVQHVRAYLGEMGRALGPWGVFLALAGGVVALKREPRTWGPALLHPLTILAVMSTANRTYSRHILPGMGTIYTLAALPVELLARHSPIAAVALTAAVGLLPLRGSIKSVNILSRPSPEDRALDWVQAHVPAGSRILETRPEGVEFGIGGGAMIGIDGARYEFLGLSDDTSTRGLRRLALDVDLLVTRPEAEDLWAPVLDSVESFSRYRAPGGWLGLGEPSEGSVELEIQAPKAHSVYAPVELSRARFSSSERSEALGALHDDDPTTMWRTAGPLRGGEWIQVEFERPVLVGRVELLLGEAPRRYESELAILVDSGDGEYRRVQAVSGCPPVTDQIDARLRGSTRPLRQVLLVEPVRCKGIRIAQLGRRDDPWSLAELRVDESLGTQPNGAHWR